MAKFELNNEEMLDLVESGVLDNMDVRCSNKCSDICNQTNKLVRRTKLIPVNKNALKENVQNQNNEMAR